MLLLFLSNFCFVSNIFLTIIFFTFSTISFATLCCRKKRKLNKPPTSKQTRADVKNENTKFFKKWPEEHVNPDKVGYDTLSGINKEEVFPIRTERDYQKLPPTKSLAPSKSSIWIATKSYYGDDNEEKTKNNNHSTYIKKEELPKTRLGKKKKKKKKTKQIKKEEKLAKIKKKRKDKD
uniref:Candidate secreted effector n=1 Tax=Meloidogyne incognita TaxID=6306 RepID=A0A914KY97_MELIC